METSCLTNLTMKSAQLYIGQSYRDIQISRRVWNMVTSEPPYLHGRICVSSWWNSCCCLRRETIPCPSSSVSASLSWCFPNTQHSTSSAIREFTTDGTANQDCCLLRGCLHTTYIQELRTQLTTVPYNTGCFYLKPQSDHRPAWLEERLTPPATAGAHKEQALHSLPLSQRHCSWSFQHQTIPNLNHFVNVIAIACP